MNISNKYRFYVGSVRGVIQSTQCVPNEKIEFSKPETASEITALEWGRSSDEILIGYKSGYVELNDANLNEYMKFPYELNGKGPITGIGCCGDTIIITKKDGTINIFNDETNDHVPMNLQENSTLDVMVCNRNRRNIIGTGGEANDFKLFDIEKKQYIFKAKSMGHDKLNLPIPTSIRGITFLTENEHLSVCATKEGHVLLYDDRAQRRPVVKFFEDKASYTCIANAFRERQCLVGTTRGYLQLLDLKSPGKCLKTFTTFTGSVTSIVCDPIEPIVATTSLDRFLRIHNLETKALLHKMYLKQSLTKILMKPVVKEEIPKEEEEEGEKGAETGKQSGDIDEEYEELFNNMETVIDGKSSKKRKLALEKTPKKRKINPLALQKSNEKSQKIKKKSKKKTEKCLNPVSLVNKS